MIPREASTHLQRASELYPAVVVTGPRQSGKTTLCRAIFPDHEYVNLEPLDRRERVLADPRGFLAGLSGGVILDEAQNTPELFGYLQEEVDRDPTPGRFVITGSQHFAMSKAISQSLAGRVGLITLLAPSLSELRQFPTAPTDLWSLLFSGSYPRVYDAGIPAGQWLRDDTTTYVQRDVRQVLEVSDLTAFTTFVRLCAANTGNELNDSRLASDAGVTQPTAKSWLSVLETSLLVTRLPAFHANIRKQLVKAPKLHFLDSGLVCHLLGIRTPDELELHPLRGAIFESWVVSEVAKMIHHRGEDPRLWHLRMTRGPQVDLIVERGPRRLLVEAKSGRTVGRDAVKNLEAARELLAGDPPGETTLVHGGDERASIGPSSSVPWSSIDTLIPDDPTP